jgi:hypothetical protein
MAYAGDGRLPVIYVRGFAGTAIDKAVEDPFYGFNEGSVHVRVDGKDLPQFHQFEGPLLRLMMGDEPYELLVHGDQQGYLERSADGSVPAHSIWVHRFYDVSATSFSRPRRRPGDRSGDDDKARRFSIEAAANDLFELIQLVRRKTGAPKVFLVAHSMGGLICRSVIQRVIPEQHHEQHPQADTAECLSSASRYVARVFTYATPHGGIEFDVGWGLVEKFRDLTGFQGADIFGKDRMYQYLTPNLPGVPGPGEFDPHVMPPDGFPLDDLFCLVGTNPEDYTVARGLSSWAVGVRSDGLVQIDNAYVQDAHRAMVHRSHSGRFGIVNSEEGYQNLWRFLFGDLQVKADLVGLDVLGTAADDVIWQLETALSIRGLPVLVHEQSTAHYCPIQIERRSREDTAGTPVPLLTTFLSSSAERPADPSGTAVPTLRHALKLRLISVRERDGVFSLQNHLEQTEDWQDVLIVDIAPATAEEPPRAWAKWNSALPMAIRDWRPDATPVARTDPAAAGGPRRAARRQRQRRAHRHPPPLRRRVTAISGSATSGRMWTASARMSLPAAQLAVMSTSSTAASTRLPVAASAASIRNRIVWPANADRLTVAVAQAAARLVAAPGWLNTWVVLPVTTLTRKKSALLALLRCARYQENERVIAPLGRVIAGDWTLVTPPSTSASPAAAPAAEPVTRSLLPLTVVPSCRVTPPLVVAAGSARTHAPVVAVSVAPALTVQPVAVSKLSENTVVPGGGPLPQFGSPACTGTDTAFQAAFTVVHSAELAPNRLTAALSEASRALAYRHVEVFANSAL